MGRGCFITLEGGEGTGKSTQISLLRDHLITGGHDVVVTREPGGSPGAEEIRALLVAGEPGRWSPMSEALLMCAARKDHVEKVIEPALKRGSWVICDRFSDSTFAYQGRAGGLGFDAVRKIHDVMLGEFKPDLTLILDLSVEEGLKRAGHRMDGDDNAEDRFEKMGAAFHESLREAYLDIARDEPQRCQLIDASGTIDQVADAIWQAVSHRLDVDARIKADSAGAEA